MRKGIVDKIYEKMLRSVSSIKGRRIYFCLEHPHSASAITCGFQMSRQLLKQGIFSYVFDLDYEAKADYEKLKSIQNSCFIFIKRAFQKHEKLFGHLRENRNIFIWNPLDVLFDLKNEADLVKFDGVIMPNSMCVRDALAYFRKDCLARAIHHHWDPRCAVSRVRDYKLVYVGDPTSENISKEHIEGLSDLNMEAIRAAKDVEIDNFFKRVRRYNCHFSVRQEGSESFRYKPNAKLVFAAGMGANIILSRDISNLELLDESYPYYTNSDLESVRAMVEYSKKTYKSKIWNKALGMIMDVRVKTSIQQIANDYVQFAEQLRALKK